MNILIIDDMLVPESSGAENCRRAVFCRLVEENRKRRNFLCREFSRLGANVLLARLRLCKKDSPETFEYCEDMGTSQVFVGLPSKAKGGLRLKELFCFNSLLTENGPSLGGLFTPDAVIAAGVLPGAVSAAAKIAETSGAVLITELSCSPAELLVRLRMASSINPMLKVLNRSCEGALRKSDAVLGFFPDAAKKFGGAHGFYPMLYPAPVLAEGPSEKAKMQREALLAFGEGGTFVLAFGDELENGRSIAELISTVGGFGDKFALVFPFGGAEKAFFKRFVAEKGITNVFFMEECEKAEAPFILSAADGIFLSESEFIKGSASESEGFFTALLAGRPVIACAEHNADFFRKAGGAIITKPRRKDSIRLGISTLLDMAESDRDILGRACRDFAEKNSPEAFARDYYSLIDNLVKQKEIKK